MLKSTVMFVLLIVSTAAFSQDAPVKPKPKPKTAARAVVPAQMSHDFRTAGRRAVAAIGDVHHLCSLNFHLNDTTDIPLCDPTDSHIKEKMSNAIKAVDEADTLHDNAVDKRATELLRNYHKVMLDEVLDKQATVVQAFSGQAPGYLNGQFVSVWHREQTAVASHSIT
jgi:hypothetical protein